MVRVKPVPKKAPPSAAPSSIGDEEFFRLSDDEINFSPSGSEDDPIVIDSSSDEGENEQQETPQDTQQQEESSDSSDEEEASPPPARRKRPVQKAFKRAKMHPLVSLKTIERPARKGHFKLSSSEDSQDEDCQPQKKRMRPLDATRHAVGVKRRRSGVAEASDGDARVKQEIREFDDEVNEDGVPVVDFTFDTDEESGYEDVPDEEDNAEDDRSVVVACRPELTRQNSRKGSRPTKKPSRPTTRGIHVLREIRRIQASTQLQIPRVAFARVCKEISQNIVNGSSLLDSPPNWQSLALTLLQTAAEDYLTVMFEDCNLVALHAKRATIFPRDMALIARLRGPSDAGFRFRAAPDRL